MRFSEEELLLIKRTFGGKEELLKLLRKVFLPEFDHNAPLGQTVDLWMTLDLRNLTTEEKLVRLQARNELITHIEQQLLQLKLLGEMKEETKEEAEVRAKKDSSK